MNLINRSIFKGMKTALEKHMEAVKGILAQYTKETNAAKEEARKFKAEDEYYKEKQKIAADKARSALEREYKDIRASLKTDAFNMKKSLQVYLAEPLNDNFVSKLKLYSDFGIKLTRTEVDSLLAQNENNPVGLRAMSHVLKATNTPWKVNFRDLGSLEEDIMKIERMAATAMYTPMEMHHEACEIFKDTKVMHLRDDGSTYEGGATHDSVSILMGSNTFTGFYEGIDAMSQAWLVDVTTPSIERASNEERKIQEDVNQTMRNAGVDEKYIDTIEDVNSTTSVESDPGARLLEELRQKSSQKSFGEAVGVYMK